MRQYDQLARRLEGSELDSQRVGLGRADRLQLRAALSGFAEQQAVELGDLFPVGEQHARLEVAAAPIAPAVNADEHRRLGEPDRFVGQPPAGAASAVAQRGDRRAVVVVVAEHAVTRRDRAHQIEALLDVVRLGGVAGDEDPIRALAHDRVGKCLHAFDLDEVEVDVGDPDHAHQAASSVSAYTANCVTQ